MHQYNHKDLIIFSLLKILVDIHVINYHLIHDLLHIISLLQILKIYYKNYSINLQSFMFQFLYNASVFL